MKLHRPASLISDLRSRKTMMTTTEVIIFLQTTRHTLCAWVRTGKIPAVRLPGNSYAFDPLTLADWLASRNISSGDFSATPAPN